MTKINLGRKGFVLSYTLSFPEKLKQEFKKEACRWELIQKSQMSDAFLPCSPWYAQPAINTLVHHPGCCATDSELNLQVFNDY